MKSALVIGASGQDGSYLCEYLLGLGDYRVFGLVRTNPSVKEHVQALVDRVQFLYGDIRDEVLLRIAIQKSWPDEIYSLAGQVSVPISWQEPAETFNLNTGGLARVLKIVEELKKDARVYQASTSEMFGNHEGRCNDQTPMNPTSPYGVSKLAAHKLVGVYRQKGIYAVSGILFNHESPRRGHEMVTRKIAQAVAAWAMGSKAMLALGDTRSRRDWGFSGDYVKAMHLMLQFPVADDYVAGTGESHSVMDFLLAACDVAGVSREFLNEHLTTDARFMRAQTEIYDMRADNQRIAAHGWRAETQFPELVRMMVEAEIDKLNRQMVRV